MCTHKFEIVFHYSVLDPSFKGEYCSVDFVVDGNLHKSWGDYYHDKGGVQAESYAQGYIKAVGHDSVVLTRINKADFRG